MSIDWLPDGPNAINGLILIAVIAIAIWWLLDKVQDDEWLEDYDPDWPKTESRFDPMTGQWMTYRVDWPKSDEVYDQEKDDE